MGTFDWEQHAVYDGSLCFPAVNDSWAGVSYPIVTIPLYIKEHPVPVRKPKVTEINTVPNQDPASGAETNVQVMFFGAPEPLQLSISGFMKTPLTKSGQIYRYRATSDGSSSGTDLGLANTSYGEIIAAYIEGRMNRSSAGRWKRTDPAHYMDPFGHKYLTPIIMTYDYNFGQPMKKQTFQMQLWLEQ